MLIKLILFMALGFGAEMGDLTSGNSNEEPQSKRSEPSKEEPVKVEQPVEAEMVEQSSEPEFNLLEEVFLNHKDFNLSLGVKKQGQEYYLIVEMDHNPAKHGFVFDLADIGHDVVMINTVRENHVFGLKNKAATFLPMIETVFANGSTEVQHISEFQTEFRTYQQVNITGVLKGLAARGVLFDVEKNLYKASDIEAIRLILAESQSIEGTPSSKHISFDLSNLKDGEIRQVYGVKELSDLTEIQRHKLGDKVTLKSDQKVPAAKSGYQWVQIAKSAEENSYKLVKELSVGDSLEVDTDMAESFLPRVQQGQRWVSVDTQEGKTKFQLVELPARTSDALIMRYISSIGSHMNHDWVEGERKSRLAELLAKSPIEIESGRITAVAEEIVNDGGKNIAEILFREQENARKPHLPVVLRCRGIFKAI